MRRHPLRVLVAGVLVLLAGAAVLWTVRDRGRDCPRTGCPDRIEVSMFDLAYVAENVTRVRACAGSHCEEVVRSNVNGIDLPLDAPPPTAVRVRASYLDARGRIVASDQQMVRREHGPNYERAGLYAARTLTAEGQLVPYTEVGRMPPPHGGPAADVVTAGHVSHATSARPSGARLRVVRGWSVEIRLDARSRVRLTVPGTPARDIHLEPADRVGRDWQADVPEQLGSSGELIVRLDRRADGRSAEFHFPIKPVSEASVDPELGPDLGG